MVQENNKQSYQSTSVYLCAEAKKRVQLIQSKERLLLVQAACLIQRAKATIIQCWYNISGSCSEGIHFQLQNNAPICPQITSKVKLTLGKSFLFL
jgi:hypothetical protein